MVIRAVHWGHCTCTCSCHRTRTICTRPTSTVQSTVVDHLGFILGVTVHGPVLVKEYSLYSAHVQQSIVFGHPEVVLEDTANGLARNHRTHIVLTTHSAVQHSTVFGHPEVVLKNNANGPVRNHRTPFVLTTRFALKTTAFSHPEFVLGNTKHGHIRSYKTHIVLTTHSVVQSSFQSLRVSTEDTAYGPMGSHRTHVLTTHSTFRSTEQFPATISLWGTLYMG